MMESVSCLSHTNAKFVFIGLVLQIVLIGMYFNSNVTSSHRSDTVRLYDFYKVILTGNLTRSLSSNVSTLSYEEVNRKRVNKLRQYCRDNKQSLSNTYLDHNQFNSLPYYVWMVSTHHKLFYCAPPKCASTSWKTYIMKDLSMQWHIDIHL